MQDLGRMLLFFGGVLVAVGVLLLVAPRIPWLGRLPGDFVFQRGPVTFHFPLVTSLIVSIVLTVLLNLFWRR
jgi:hypothetical protein